nr:MAG TPA: hypothetical protein [Caudoviricetes sp.]
MLLRHFDFVHMIFTSFSPPLFNHSKPNTPH